jgi:hypothetical protein
MGGVARPYQLLLTMVYAAANDANFDPASTVK